MSDHPILVIWVLKIFSVQFFCVFLPPLLNIFCFCSVHTISVLYWAHLCMKFSLGTLIFLKRSIVFPILLFCSISLHWSPRKAFLALLAILWNSAFPFLHCLLLLFFSQLFVRPPQTTMLPFYISFPWTWFRSLPLVQYYEPPSIVLQALYQIWSLESICHFHCILIRDLI